METEQLVIPGTEPQGQDALQAIIGLANKLVQLSTQIELAEETLNKLVDEQKNIAERLLPDAMRAVGLDKLQLSNGNKIDLKVEYIPTVPKERMAAVAEWLRERNMGGIVKEQIIVGPEYKEQMVAANVPFTSKTDIHHMSLRSVVRELIEAGTPPPQELFGVMTVDKAVVKHD